jgi:ketosteroid isomerase-like protein
VTRARAERTLARVHAAQAAFYAGGPREPLHEVLTEDIVWTVPGTNAIAGEYRGLDAVIDYFTRRRELADRSLRMHPGELLVGDGDHVAALTDGSATIDGRRAALVDGRSLSAARGSRGGVLVAAARRRGV